MQTKEGSTGFDASGALHGQDSDALHDGSPAAGLAPVRAHTSALPLTRRQLVWGAGAALVGFAAWPTRSRADTAYALPQAAKDALAKSRLVYVSPLRKSGEESSCHGEVWFFVDKGSVVIATAADRWKARAIRSGHDRARLWVGDFGPAWRAGKRYRGAPSFLARAELSKDEALFGRLMNAYAQRYADEWGKWKPRFEKGHADGSRAVVRYTPIGDQSA